MLWRRRCFVVALPAGRGAHLEAVPADHRASRRLEHVVVARLAVPYASGLSPLAHCALAVVAHCARIINS